MMLAVCRLQWRQGRASVYGLQASFSRAAQPGRFWLAWLSWLTLASLVTYRAARTAWLAASGAAEAPASGKDWLALAMVIAGALAVWLMGPGLRLWRRGNPLMHWRELRREAELREMIRSLVDDPKATWEGETLDEFAAYAELEWLEDIVVHLAAQDAPRSLQRAIEETDTEAPDATPDQTPGASAT